MGSAVNACAHSPPSPRFASRPHLTHCPGIAMRSASTRRADCARSVATNAGVGAAGTAGERARGVGAAGSSKTDRVDDTRVDSSEVPGAWAERKDGRGSGGCSRRSRASNDSSSSSLSSSLSSLPPPSAPSSSEEVDDDEDDDEDEDDEDEESLASQSSSEPCRRSPARPPAGLVAAAEGATESTSGRGDTSPALAKRGSAAAVGVAGATNTTCPACGAGNSAARRSGDETAEVPSSRAPSSSSTTESACPVRTSTGSGKLTAALETGSSEGAAEGAFSDADDDIGSGCGATATAGSLAAPCAGGSCIATGSSSVVTEACGVGCT